MDDADDRPAPRLITVKVARLYGVRKRIIREVADEYTEKLGRLVTPRRVRHAWDEIKSNIAKNV